jgi:hypothetical protein
VSSTLHLVVCGPIQISLPFLNTLCFTNNFQGLCAVCHQGFTTALLGVHFESQLSQNFQNHGQCLSDSPFHTHSTGAASNVISEEILDKCPGFYDSLLTINKKLGGKSIPKSSPHTFMLFCLPVRNHSSGKSSLIT